MTTARSGSPRFQATSAMIAAFPACSGVIVRAEPGSAQDGTLAAGPSSRTQATATTTATATSTTDHQLPALRGEDFRPGRLPDGRRPALPGRFRDEDRRAPERWTTVRGL